MRCGRKDRYMFIAMRVFIVVWPLWRVCSTTSTVCRCARYNFIPWKIFRRFTIFRFQNYSSMINDYFWFHKIYHPSTRLRKSWCARGPYRFSTVMRCSLPSKISICFLIARMPSATLRAVVPHPRPWRDWVILACRFPDCQAASGKRVPSYCERGAFLCCLFGFGPGLNKECTGRCAEFFRSAVLAPVSSGRGCRLVPLRLQSGGANPCTTTQTISTHWKLSQCKFNFYIEFSNF